MTTPPSALADLLAPMTVETFFAEYHGKKPLHIEGTPEKFASVLDWEGLSALLGQSSLWTQKSLELVLDNRKIEAPEYCVQGVDRDGRPNLLADLDKVGAWLRQGASMVLNDIDQLTPGLKAVAAVLEQEIGGKAQGNLYCSWNAHQGFGSHFDTHDVFAVHMAGEKTWRIYGCHFEHPIAHPVFKSLNKDFHDKHKGPLTREVRLKPGDLLYIPRGWYHDALATSEATFHVAFGLTSVIGLDIITMLFEAAVHESLFRAPVPRPADGGGADPLAAHLAALGDGLAALARSPAILKSARQYVDTYRYPRASIRLPDDALERRFCRRTKGVSLFQKGGAWFLGNAKQGVRVPDGLNGPIAWMLDREDFSEPQFEAAFPDLPKAKRDKVLADMVAMQVIAPA